MREIEPKRQRVDARARLLDMLPGDFTQGGLNKVRGRMVPADRLALLGQDAREKRRGKFLFYKRLRRDYLVDDGIVPFEGVLDDKLRPLDRKQYSLVAYLSAGLSVEGGFVGNEEVAD